MEATQKTLNDKKEVSIDEQIENICSTIDNSLNQWIATLKELKAATKINRDNVATLQKQIDALAVNQIDILLKYNQAKNGESHKLLHHIVKIVKNTSTKLRSKLWKFLMENAIIYDSKQNNLLSFNNWNVKISFAEWQKTYQELLSISQIESIQKSLAKIQLALEQCHCFTATEKQAIAQLDTALTRAITELK